MNLTVRERLCVCVPKRKGWRIDEAAVVQDAVQDDDPFVLLLF
jgi:hypothetical protein